MKKLTLVVGGVRSGKSTYAVTSASDSGNPVIFIATAIPFDEEMQKRIDAHKASRPSSWKLIEEGKDIAGALNSFINNAATHTVVIDCLGVFITNLLMDELEDEEIMIFISNIIDIISKCQHHVIIVSNEVGMGVVPDNKLARRFRDLVGFANQMIAKSANQVVVMQCGIPMCIKGGETNEQIR